MNQRFKNTDVTDALEKLNLKYLERRKQPLPPGEVTSGPSDEAGRRLFLAHNKSNQPCKELKSYHEALRELLKAVASHPDQFASDHSLHGSNVDLSADSTVVPLQDSQLLFTETDVTLPSCLDGSSVSQDTDRDRQLQWARQFPASRDSSSSVLVAVYREMMTIYEQLKAERRSQQQWERELHEREGRLKQQEEAFGRLAGLEETVHTSILAVQEKHQQELDQLQDLLRERSKENKRLRSSFDTIKELNSTMKKQLNEFSEQNKKLESQSKRVQARLENLQRKYEHSIASTGCQKGSAKSTECMKYTYKKEKTSAPGRQSEEGSSSPTPRKLLLLLLDWVLDGPIFGAAAGNEVKGVRQCLPPEVVLSERCLKVLPLLADELHRTPLSEPELLLNLLRLTYWALRHLDSSTQHVALSATLRRIGEVVSRPSAQSTVLQFEDPDLPTSCIEAAGPFRSWPLYRSSCPHTRILSILIILRTVTQADVLAQALDSLHTELMCEESRGLYIRYGGVRVLLSMLRAGRAGLHTAVDILMQLTQQSRYLNSFLEACSCEEFLSTASQLLKNPRLELPTLEKLSILLQKLSGIRKNRRLFELTSLHLQIQELHHKTNPTHTFLCLNLRSILHNLK
ncbi:coiled-coil domain-containing protein 138-like isoform X2 [Mugil cephalus]|uniref:coiled-coil domain-containing protein 138-like isoform X2 n=1 Tax=Mugil cephalus TaxID=48193 RepID=UPI001FB71663|nr:coiled-coil domain-containing protein 138-like isoform X2 [Mugil cephalus]